MKSKNWTMKMISSETCSKVYDSFKLNSFQRLLDSAKASQTMLISHQSNSSHSVPPSEKPAKLSSSIHKLLRSVPRPKPAAQVWKCGSTICDSLDLNLFKYRIDKFQESDYEKDLVWDCGSTLYDSFELNSIKLQIDKIQESDKAKALVWNCGSTLYDSFELNSIKRQIDKIQESGNANILVRDRKTSLYDSLKLDSIKLHLDSTTASRATSMPNLPDRRTIPPFSVAPSKKPSKLSRSIHKLLPSVRRRKRSSSANSRGGDLRRDKFNAVNGNIGPIGSIREALEINLETYSPEISSLVRRTVSERLAASSIGIARSTFNADRYFSPSMKS